MDPSRPRSWKHARQSDEVRLKDDELFVDQLTHPLVALRCEVALVREQCRWKPLENPLDIEHGDVASCRPFDQGGVVPWHGPAPGRVFAELTRRDLVGPGEKDDRDAATLGLGSKSLEIGQVIVDADPRMSGTCGGRGRLGTPSVHIIHQHKVSTIANQGPLGQDQRPGRNSVRLVRLAAGLGGIVPAERDQQQVGIVLVDLLEETQEALV